MAVKSLEEQLSKIAIKKAKLSNGETLAEVMAREAHRLAECIQYYIDEWYNSYEPTVYDRTYRLHGALYAEDIADIRVVGNTLRISVIFNEDLAIHESFESVGFYDKDEDRDIYYEFNPHDTFVPLLFNNGWRAPRLAHILGRNIYMLTYFHGAHFIEAGIEKFNQTNRLGIKIDDDDFFKGKAY